VVVKPQPLIISGKGINRERSYLRNLCKKILLIIIARKLLRGNTNSVPSVIIIMRQSKIYWTLMQTARCGRGHMQPEKKYPWKARTW